MSRSMLRLMLFLFLLAPFTFAAGPQTFIYLNSQSGDWVGGGTKQFFTPADGTFTAQTLYNGGVEISFNTSNYSSFWYLDFGPADGQAFTPGVYEGAQRFAFHSPTKPGIDVSGDGRGCNTDAGRFLLSDLAFNSDGTVQRFAVDFEQHCEGAPPALYGSVRYNSSISAIPRVSVADASVLKGNAGTSDGGVLLSLSIPSNRIVTVQYATSDGSGVHGVDYVSSGGTVEFQPGITSMPINIPILGNLLARGNRTFHVLLSSPVGAPLGDRSANINTLDPNVPLTAVAMSSQPGDYIGQGGLYLYTTADGVFTPTENYDNGVNVTLQTSDLWDFDFAAPNSALLTAGVYENAQRFPFQPMGVPGLSVDGQGRGCNTLTGNFAVNRIVFSGSSVQSFSADLEQHCEGAVPALFAWLSINSSLRQLSVTDAVIDNLSSTAVFTITLHPASSVPVSVDFITADGTAQAGIDYVATSQTVHLPAGTTSETVTVPLLKNPDGGKVFYGQLSSSIGSAIWISQSSATF